MLLFLLIVVKLIGPLLSPRFASFENVSTNIPLLLLILILLLILNCVYNDGNKSKVNPLWYNLVISSCDNSLLNKDTSFADPLNCS